MHLNPHVSYDGNCAEALAFYEHVFGVATKFKMTWGESPMAGDTPPGTHGRILHAAFEIGSSTLMLADTPAGCYQKPQGVFISIELAATAEAARLFAALSEGGRIVMPFQPTFWSKGFGMLHDRFGAPWMLNSSEPQ